LKAKSPRGPKEIRGNKTSDAKGEGPGFLRRGKQSQQGRGHGAHRKKGAGLSKLKPAYKKKEDMSHYRWSYQGHGNKRSVVKKSRGRTVLAILKLQGTS